MCATVSCKASCKACICTTASCNASFKEYALGLHIKVTLEGRTTRIWYFGCGFACATTIGCAGFRLSFGIIIFFIIINYH